MRRNMKLYLLLIFFFFTRNYLYSQESQNPPQKYRIVAVNASDDTICSISNEIELYLPLALRFPSAFSPNGDGLNDTFGAVGEGVDQYRLIIFNRWGNVIFESDNLHKKWDGRFNGELVAPGSYNYEVFAEGKEFGKLHKADNVIVTK